MVALGRLFGVEIDVEKQRVGISLVGVLEGLGDVFLAQHLIPFGGAVHFVGLLGDGFVHYIPGVHFSLIAAHYGMNVVAQALQ